MDLKNKVALVTGGARGIGRAICVKLASLGADVVVSDVCSLAAASETLDKVKRLGRRSMFVKADVSVASEVKQAIDLIIKDLGHIDILVNNAGITKDNLLIRMKEEDWDKVLAVNLKGAFNCTQAVARQMMKQRQGVIVNVASVVGISGNAGQANYSASKAGVIALTKTTAKELASRGIRANAVAPGFIKTKMTEKLPDKIKESIREHIPLKDFGGPEDIANAIAFLASDEARYITGQVLTIDGGMLM